MEPFNTEPYLGIPCSQGIGIGRIFKIKDKKNTVPSEARSPEEEMLRIKKALAEYKKRTLKLAEKVDINLGKGDGDIIRSHIAIVEDVEMNELLYKFVNSGKSADQAVDNVCGIFANIFDSMEDEYMRQKSVDILDISTQVRSILAGEEYLICDVPEGTVLLGKNIQPSLVSSIENGNVVGIISEYGNETSHSAILAKALKIPMISGVSGIYDSCENDQKVIVNAIEGEVILDPDRETCKVYEKREEEYAKKVSELEKYFGKPTKTKDGATIKILCNISGPADIRKVIDNDGEGVGLLRTELLFMNSRFNPGEAEQFDAYKRVASAMNDKPVIIRTLDIGGDKEISYLELPQEDNPFLGFRAIRYTLKETEIFKIQLRSILRASAYGNVSILLPMITTLDELLQAKELIEECKDELRSEQVKFNENIRVGCMIETPSAAMISDILAGECDFFSIGTNDLIQYTMCADRGNSRVSYLYSSYQPSVIRLIERVAKAAKEAGIPVGICGEAASNEFLLPLLIALDFDEVSVNASSVLELRKNILGISKEESKAVTEKVLKMSSEDEIFNYLSAKS
jgi:phosphotransferase system enzyme I (PtsI)